MYYHALMRQEEEIPMIVAYASGDVTGDKILDHVYLTGIKTVESPFIQKITLMIQDGMTGRVTRIPLKENAGYSPTLFLGDFTGDGIADILIGIASGGSGGIMYYYIYSFVAAIPQLRFDFEQYNQAYTYEISYREDYKVKVVSNKNNQKYFIDLSYKGKDYLNEIYTEKGELKSPIEGFVNPLSGLYPVDFDSNKVYELLAYQKIAGRYNADAIGYIQNILKWEKNSFVLDRQYVAIFGAEI